MCLWKFRPKSNGEVKVDPIQDRFFTTSDVGDITTALVREAIQNSLDARLDKETTPAKVRFYLNSNGIESEKINKYLSHLEIHLKSDKSGLENSRLPCFNDKLPFLIIEDFNTTGLEGDTEQDDDLVDNKEPDNFYWFWRNIARSGKSLSDDGLGRWGVGKTVFPASSRINTFFGLTVRNSDGEKYLLGQSVLKWHIHNDKWYCPYGFFGFFEDGNDYFASPIFPGNDQDFIHQFENDFQLDRKNVLIEEKKSGLSIVIPFPNEKISTEKIIRTTIKHYFYAIISGKLVVKIDSAEDQSITLSKDSLISELKKIHWENHNELRKLEKICSLTQYSLEVKEEDFIQFLAPDPYAKPQWRDPWLKNDYIEKSINDSIEKFENGEPICFKIPLKIQKIDCEPKIGYYKAFVQYDGHLTEIDKYFIRDEITLTGIKTLNKKGIRILIIIDDKDMAKMFGDSENPAHTEFQANSPHFLNKYVDGNECISFMINTVGYLYKNLTQSQEGKDEDILKDIFYIERSDVEEKKHDKPRSSGEYEKNDSSPEIDDPNQKINIGKINGGFRIQNRSEESLHGKIIDIKMAYSVLKGKPFDKYSPYDFRLNEEEINIGKSGIEILVCKNNYVQFKIIDSIFFIQITGFDTNRDLVIKFDIND